MCGDLCERRLDAHDHPGIVLDVVEREPAVVELAQTLLHIMLWSSVIMGMSMVLSGLMRASGTVLVPTVITMLAIAGIEIPTAWALSHHFGLNGIWAAYPIELAEGSDGAGAYYAKTLQQLNIRPTFTSSDGSRTLWIYLPIQ